MTQLNYMMITANPEIATFIERHGVARIFMDQEVLGKAERQGHLNTHKAAHTLKEIETIANALQKAELMVRLNPLNKHTHDEINAALDHGAQRLMLPMFNSRTDVEQFYNLVNSRVPISLLVETPQSLVHLPDWLPLLKPGYDEVHFGLNDLSLGMGLNFLFEPMACRLFDTFANYLNDQHIRWGVGGIARIGQGELPAEIILGEHVRLGSQWVILSRAFHQEVNSSSELLHNLNFPAEITKLREAEAHWRQSGPEILLSNQNTLAECAFRLGRNTRGV